MLILFADDLSWWSSLDTIWKILGILFIIAVALIILLSKGRVEVQEIETKRADASDKLVKVRDLQIADLTKEKGDLTEQNEKLDEELEEVTGEYRAVLGIKISELMEFWAEKENIQAQIVMQNREIRILRRALDIPLDKPSAEVVKLLGPAKGDV